MKFQTETLPDIEVGGVLIDGKLHGGYSYVFYTGTYDCIRYDATLRKLVAV
jgi:hypothetical protein